MTARTKRVKDESSIVDELPPLPTETRNDQEMLAFLQAIDTWKRKSGRNFPSWSDVLDILHGLGYRKFAH